MINKDRSSSADEPHGYWCEFCDESIPIQNDNDATLHLNWHIDQTNSGNMFTFSVGTIDEAKCTHGNLHKVVLTDNRRIELQSSEHDHPGERSHEA